MAIKFEEDFLGNFLSEGRVSHDCARRREHCPVMKRECLVKTCGRISPFSLAWDRIDCGSDSNAHLFPN